VLRSTVTTTALILDRVVSRASCRFFVRAAFFVFPPAQLDKENEISDSYSDGQDGGNDGDHNANHRGHTDGLWRKQAADGKVCQVLAAISISN